MKKKSARKLTHIDAANRPRMVDVGHKAVTRREATARAVVVAPPAVMKLFVGGDILGPKGPVFQTAIVAGTGAVKRTSDLIPFCHPLPIDGCRILITVNKAREIVIDCTVRVQHRTGVEMEALVGASVAALTIYDMCKAVSHDIRIRETRLMRKRGGQHDVDVPSV
ncbi:MAG: cyclic pyranopterin monophosphate synthase MoaC [Verrucomicrobia bacterium]|nr:cyclic pyranopterin monophosphate synthase MoaC [Verrucomicrobiota bacterium]